MGSLSTKEGTPREKNYQVEETRFGDFQTQFYRNGLPTTKGPVKRWWIDTLSDTYYGVDLFNFHKRKASGELLPFTQYLKVTQELSLTAHWKELISQTAPNGDILSHDWSQLAGPVGAQPLVWGKSPGGGYLPVDTGLANLAAVAINQQGINPAFWTQHAASKLYSRGWDALTFLAELHKTYQLISEAAGRLLDLVTQYDRFVQELSKQGIDSWSIPVTFQSWLEARYGWRLLLYDIQDIQDVIWKLGNRSRKRNKANSGAEFTWSDDWSYSEAGSNFTASYSDIRVNRLNFRGFIVADFEPSLIKLNPVTTAWEIVPWSFVIDFFLGVGTWLEALSFLALNDTYTAAYGYQYEVTRTGNLSFTGLGDSVWKVYQTVDQHYEVLRRVPVVVSTIPLPSHNFDVLKGLDLIALSFGLVLGLLKKSAIR